MTSSTTPHCHRWPEVVNNFHPSQPPPILNRSTWNTARSCHKNVKIRGSVLELVCNYTLSLEYHKHSLPWNHPVSTLATAIAFCCILGAVTGVQVSVEHELCIHPLELREQEGSTSAADRQNHHRSGSAISALGFSHSDLRRGKKKDRGLVFYESWDSPPLRDTICHIRESPIALGFPSSSGSSMAKLQTNSKLGNDFR